MKSHIFLILICSCLSTTIPAQTAGSITDAANAFLNTLNSDEVQRVSYSFEDSARLKWTNLPVGMVPRPGLQYGTLGDESRISLQQLLTTVLSSQGYLKITSIMQLDDILNLLTKEAFEKQLIDQTTFSNIQNLRWAFDNFYISFYGDPDLDSPWGMNFGGHHVSLNLTVVGGKVSMTPLFLGSDPAEVRNGKYSGIRVLSSEQDYGFMLLDMMSADQLSRVIVSEEVPRDIITNPNSSQRISEYYGIPVKEFTANQKEMLQFLIQEYIHNFEHDLAHQLYSKILNSGLEKIYFAWIGSKVKNLPHYYIIHGPDFIIEYDNYPRSGNHIHLILRESGNDFGEDILKTHYLNSEHHR